MAQPLKGKLPWRHRLHYRYIWYKIKHGWVGSKDLRVILWEDRHSYCILAGGVLLGGLISLYIMFY